MENQDISLGGKQLDVLQIINRDKGEAFGGSIAIALENDGKRTALPQIYSILEKLEKKGLVKHDFTEPLKTRGGRRRKVYKITGLGERVIHSNLPKQMAAKPSSGWIGIPGTVADG